MRVAGFGSDPSRTLLTAAVLAPSIHNTQPWRFEVGSRTVRVYRDLERWPRAEDPRKNGLYISLGAVVLNLRVAAADLGRLAHVTLLPESKEADHVATLTLATGLGVDHELAALFPYLNRRRTSRQPFSDRWVADRPLRELKNVARLEDGVLRVIREPDRVRRVLALAAEEAGHELFDLHKLEERARWVGGARRDDGIPTRALGPLPVDGRAVVRDLAVRQADRQRPVARFERHPVLAVLSVRRDDELGWLRAGQALERVLLTAAQWGLSASFLNQALANPRLRLLVHEPTDGELFPQMLLRLGYGELPDRVPRRPLEDFAVPARDGRHRP